MPGDLKNLLERALFLARGCFVEDSNDQANCEAGLGRIGKLVTKDGHAFTDARSKEKVSAIMQSALARMRLQYDEDSFVLDNLKDVADEIELAAVLEEKA